MTKYEKVYEWNLAYRIDHWVRAAAISILVFTGYYIYRPFLSGSENIFLMAWMRFFHFAAMYVAIMGLVAHIYFDKDINAVIPTWSKVKDMPDILAYYLFLKDTHKEYEKYNPLQAVTYSIWGILIIVQMFTGFAIYSGKAFGIIDAKAAFGWVNALLGGEPITRLVHFSVMWIFIITVPVHVYMVVLKHLTDRDNTFWSMFTGYKFKQMR